MWHVTGLQAGVVCLFLLGICQHGLTAEAESTFAGITEPVKDVKLSAWLNAATVGIIDQRFFKQGDFVKEGQPVIALDKKNEELEVERRKLLAELLRMDRDRLRRLSKSSSAVSQQELDKKEAEYNIAVVEHQLVQEQLRRRVIVSPISGSVVELPVEVGEACQANQLLARIVDTRQCYFVCNVEARSALRLHLGQSVKLEIETGATPVVCEGKVSFISPVLDPASGLLKVKVLFENPDNKIRPGVAGKIRLTGPSHAP